MDHSVLSVTPETGGGATVVIQDLGNAPYPAKVLIHTTSGGVVERDISVEHWLDGNTEAEIWLPASVGSVTRVEVDPSGYEPDVDRSNNFWPRG